MSRYNPFAKPKIGLGANPSSSTITTQSADAQSQQDPLTIEDDVRESGSSCAAASSAAAGTTFSNEPVEVNNASTESIQPERAISPKIYSPAPPHNVTSNATPQVPFNNLHSTPPHSVPYRQPPITPHQVSRWRLLWRGGLEVGTQRYKLDGIAFCAKMTFSIPVLPAARSAAGTPTGQIRTPVEASGDTPVESVQAMLGKEVTMREEGSYFPSNATQSSTTITTSSRLDSITPAETTQRRRPLLQTQPSSSFDHNPVFTPGGSLTAKAFETSDPDLCLSLESMKGRQTLRVRGVERLKDDDLLEDAQQGENGVHV